MRILRGRAPQLSKKIQRITYLWYVFLVDGQVNFQTNQQLIKKRPKSKSLSWAVTFMTVMFTFFLPTIHSCLSGQGALIVFQFFYYASHVTSHFPLWRFSKIRGTDDRHKTKIALIKSILLFDFNGIERKKYLFGRDMFAVSSTGYSI